MKDNSKKDAKQKKPYTKPEVKQVQLKPEEAVGVVAKVIHLLARPKLHVIKHTHAIL